MPEGRIDLQDGLGDAPQVRIQVSKMEKYLPSFKEYTTLLRDTFLACSVHQEKVCEGTDALAKLLTSLQAETLGETESIVPKAFFRLSRYLSELHSCQDMMSSQLHNAVIELLSQFITNDFGKLEKLRENFEASCIEHEQASIKFSRISKKKESEKTRFEANADLFAARKKFYENSLDYHSELNSFQHKKKFALLEPLLTFMHAQMAYFKVGHEILNKELGKILVDLNTEVQRVHEDFQKELRMSAQTRADLELRFPTLCLPDPDPMDPFSNDPLVPSTNLTSKTGYLFIRTQSGFPSKWDRAYFFTKKGYLYIHLPNKAPELIIHLKGAEATPTDIDDRRYAFMVNHSSLKRPIYLMAENDIIKDEWIATINNIGYDRGQALPRSNTKRDEAIIKVEREKIRSWVNKELDPKKDKGSVPKIPKASPIPSSTSSAFSSHSSTFPSISSFLNFRDTSNQSDNTTTTPSRKSPVPQRKSPLTLRKSSNSSVKPNEPLSTAGGGVISSSQPTNLPSPLQPERLTVGVTPTTRQQLGYTKTFYVKYLGHMEVQEGRNITVITDTIQKVMTARAIRNVREAQAIEMTITHKSVSLYDHSSKKAIGQIILKDILRCAVQPENTGLFGIVNRSSGEGDGKSKFLCHVMEANKSGMQICSAVNEAIQVAIRLMQSKHVRSKSITPLAPVQQSNPKDEVDSFVFPKAAPSKPPPPSVSLAAGIPSTTNGKKSPSKVFPKQKSISDSNLTALKGTHPRPTQSGSSVISNSPSQSSLNSASSSEDFMLFEGQSETPPNNLNPSSTLMGYSAMPPLVENETSLTVNRDTVGGAAGGGGGGGSHMITPTSALPAAVAASSSNYYPMPTSLLVHGGPISASSTNGNNQQDLRTSPLPPFAIPLEESGLSIPPLDPNQFEGNVNKSKKKPASDNITTSASVDSGYYQMPGTLQANHAADTSSAMSTPPQFENGTLIQSSFLPSEGSSSVYLATTAGNAMEPEGDTSLEPLQLLGGESELSSSDAIFDVSSSSQKSSRGGGYELGGQSTLNGDDSGYLPAPVPPDLVSSDTSSLLDTSSRNTESAFTPSTNVSSSLDGFPASFEDNLDDFDLPPLPDSVELPTSSRSGDASLFGYGGSIVTFSTPQSKGH